MVREQRRTRDRRVYANCANCANSTNYTNRANDTNCATNVEGRCRRAGAGGCHHADAASRIDGHVSPNVSGRTGGDRTFTSCRVESDADVE